MNGRNTREKRKGEIIIPATYQTPELTRYLEAVMGQELQTYTIGSGKERINPKSGLPAFFDTDTDEEESDASTDLLPVN